MTMIHFEASAHRLRLEGRCRDDDAPAVREALRTFTPMTGGRLLVDLTRVTEIDPTVAEQLVAAVRECRRRGVDVTLIRKHRSVVDDALIAAESEDGS